MVLQVKISNNLFRPKAFPGYKNDKKVIVVNSPIQVA